MAIDKALFGRIDGARSRFDFKQRERDCAGQMTLEPLGAAANVDELQVGIWLRRVLNILASLHRDACEFNAQLTGVQCVHGD